jgi:membrane associated rhomboid family serine protease
MNKITLVIIIINVLFSINGFNNRDFFEKYKFQIGPITNGDYIRILSSGFLHVDFNHLLFNMLTLYFFADILIASIGSISFLIIYFTSMVAGNVLTYFYHKDNHYYSAVGASGAVMGVLFSFILLFPTEKIYIMFIPIGIPAYIVGVAYLAYTVFGMKRQLGNIGHSAHLGGAIGGLLLMLIMYPALLQTRTLTLLLLAIPLALFLIFGKRLER